MAEIAELRAARAAKVAEKLGAKVVPTGARGVMEKVNPNLITRPGGPTPQAEEKAAPELAGVFGE